MILMICISVSTHSLTVSLTHLSTVTSAGIKAQMSAPGLSHTKSRALTLRGAELTDRDKRRLCLTPPAPWSDGAARRCVVRQKTALSGTVHGLKNSTFSTIHLYLSVICNLPPELWHWYCSHLLLLLLTALESVVSYQRWRLEAVGLWLD